MSTSQEVPEVKNTTDTGNTEPGSPIFTKTGVKRGRTKGSNSSTPGSNKIPRKDESSEESDEIELEEVKTNAIEPAQSGTMARVLHNRPQTIGKPFRDWEGAHPPTKELNKNAKCASYQYTLNELTNKLGGLDIVRTHPEQLHKHLLEREFCGKMRSTIHDLLTKLLIHNLMESDEQPHSENDMLSKIRDAAYQLADKDLVENKKKF